MPIAAAVVGITRAARRPPKAAEMSSTRTPAAIETMTASGRSRGETSAATSRQICGLTASSTVGASASTESGGLSRAPSPTAPSEAGESAGSRTISWSGEKAATRVQP